MKLQAVLLTNLMFACFNIVFVNNWYGNYLDFHCVTNLIFPIVGILGYLTGVVSL